MAQLPEYLEWRGDLSFLAAPFCEADALLLSELSYVDFESVLSEREMQGALSLPELSARYWAKHEASEIESRLSSTKAAPFLLKQAVQTARFSDVRVCRMKSMHLAEDESQFAAATFLLPEDSACVVFRGTDDTLVGWKEDFNMFFLSHTKGQLLARAYLEEAARAFPGPLRVAGHSKGGNFAVYAAMQCEESTFSRLVSIFAADAPGFKSETVSSPAYARLRGRVDSFVPEDSFFGMLLEGSLEDVVIKSVNTGLHAHDAMSWEIKGSSLCRSERRSDNSYRAEQTVRSWVGSFNDEERRVFIDAIYAALDSTGATRLSELREPGSLRIYAEAYRYLRALPETQKAQIANVLKALAASGAETLASELPRPGRKLLSGLLRQEDAENASAE